jgi:hypothetical protein
MAKVALVFPPFWDPSYPYLSLPLLSAFLKQHGHYCTKVDLNLKFIYELFSPQFISLMAQRVENALSSTTECQTSMKNQRSLRTSLLVASAINKEEVIESAQRAVKTLKHSELFFNRKELKQAYDSIDLVAALFRGAYWPAHFRLPEWSIEIGDSGISSVDALNLAKDDVNNPFLPFMASFTREELPSDVQIIGISISYPQLVPALTLARQIRLAGHSAKIVLGGGLVAKILPGILGNSEFFEHVDAFVSGEGELPLLELACRCETRENWDGIPGVAVETHSGIDSIGMQPLPIGKVCFPDFDDLPLDQYLVPYRILPLASARGCYWDKCTFCARRELYSGGYRERSNKTIVEEMHFLATRYKTRYFLFCDESLSPRTLSGCSELLNKRKMDYRWGAWLRVDRAFTTEIWEKAAKSGFSYALVGVESYSTKILKGMRKGSTPRMIERQLNDMIAHNIHPALFIMFGFPGETEESCRETIKSLVRHREKLSVHDISLFSVDVLSEIWRNQKTYGISPDKPLDPRLDLCVYLPHECYSVEDTIDHAAMISYREELLAKIAQDVRFRYSMFLYSCHGMVEPAIETNTDSADIWPVDRLSSQVIDSKVISIGKDVKVVHSDIDLDGETTTGRFEEPLPFMVKFHSGEVFGLSPQFTILLDAFDDGEISWKELNQVWQRLGNDNKNERFTLERFIQLGISLGIFQIRQVD